MSVQTAALYVRTSTEDQDGTGQLYELRRAAVARGWAQYDLDGDALSGLREFVDLGHSGSKASRPAWDELRAAVKRGEVRRLMVSELSRLGRNTGNVVLAMDELARAGCELVVLREGFDYSTDAGKLIATIFAALAQFERSQINARTRSALAAKKAAGVKLGRPERSVPLEEMRRLRLAGRSVRQIAAVVGVPRATVARALAGVSKT